jgi:hypothetical protein
MFSARFPMTQFAIGVGLMTLAYALAAHLAIAETNLPANTRPATTADIAWMTAVGIPNPVVGMPVDSAHPTLGQAAGEAKIWLMQRTKLDKSRIICLNAQFAQNLKSLMENAPGGPPEITDGYRTTSEQQAAINSGASRVSNVCSGYHLYGLAADFNNTNKQTLLWMRQNASRFGLTHLPAMDVTTGCSRTGSGYCDPAHFQTQGPVTGQCGVCSAGGVGGTSVGGSPVSSAPKSPIQNAMGALQNLFSPPPENPATQALSQLQAPTSLSPFLSQPSNPPAPVSTVVSNPISADLGGNTNTNSNQNTGSATAVSDLINAIAYPSSTPAAKPSATGTTIALNAALSNPVTLQPAPRSATSENMPTQTVLPQQSASQTFVSQDLSQNTVPAYAPPSTAAASILENLKRVLLLVLDWLKTLGSPAKQTPAEPTTVIYRE